MKIRRRDRQVAMLGVATGMALAGLAAMSAVVHGDVLQWDGNGTAPLNPAGGSGTWEGANNWWNGSSSQSYSTGAAPHDAIFGVVAGAVNIASVVTASSLTINVGGYSVGGGTLAMSSGGTITVTNPADVATISAVISGASGFTKLGAGTLTLSSSVANTFTAMNIKAGTVSFAATGHLGDVNSLITIDGGTLRQTGSATTSPATRNFFASPAGATFNITSSGNGLTIAGRLDGPGLVTKSGSGTLRFDRANSTFSAGLVIADGIVRFNNNNDAGPKSLRMNRITFGANASMLSIGGSGAGDDEHASELRTGEWNSTGGATGSVIAATTVTDTLFGASGHDILIDALADGTFAGVVNNTRLANGGGQGNASHDGNFRVRGLATQTLTGTTTVNNTITVFQNAGLTLAGNAVMTGQGINLNLRGGTMTLDNSGTNLADRLRNTGPIETRGGGTFALVGNSAGSSESIGALQLGTLQTIRSGAITVSVTHNAASAATVLNFDTLTRDHGSTTVDFTAHNGAGATLPLGGAGNAPRINFVTTPAMQSGTNLLQSVSGATGWATVNGSSFATSGANGIEPVATVSFATSGTSDNALLNTTQTISGGTDQSVGSLKIDPSAGQTLDLSGSANLVTPAILLAGGNDFEIRNSGGGTGAIAPVSTLFAHMQNATLKISAPIIGGNGIVKAGQGTLEVSGANSYSGATTLNAGVLRANPATSLGSGPLEFRGGVLEITGGGTFARNLGTAAGEVNWSNTSEDRGSGGFAARGAPASIDLSTPGPTNIFYEATNFLESGYDLVFGSRTADAAITWTDNLILNTLPDSYNTRDFRVIDNPSSSSDIARITGVISSDTVANNGVLSDVLKTGDGALELTAANTYVGGTIIAEGTLLAGNNNALGDGAAPYVLLGNRGGTANAALLTSAAVNISRTITIQAGNTGIAMIGGSTADDSTFSGTLLINHDLTLTAAAGGVVHLTAPLTTTKNLTKTGEGTVELQHLRAGAVALSAGVLRIAANGGADGAGKVTSITATGGKLDLLDNDLVVTSGGVLPIRTLIMSGYLGNGGIITSAAAPAGKTARLGYAQGNDTAITALGGSLSGQTFIADANHALVKFTYQGDSDLDGDVDGIDVSRWASNFTGNLGLGAGTLSPAKVWTQGDWDYDGDVDGIDVSLWANNFNGSGGGVLGGGINGLTIDAPDASPSAVALLAQVGVTVVPEPASIGLLAAVGAGLLAARRRK